MVRDGRGLRERESSYEAPAPGEIIARSAGKGGYSPLELMKMLLLLARKV